MVFAWVSLFVITGFVTVLVILIQHQMFSTDILILLLQELFNGMDNRMTYALGSFPALCIFLFRSYPFHQNEMHNAKSVTFCISSAEGLTCKSVGSAEPKDDRIKRQRVN